MASPSTLIIPIENQVRELDAKLLLGCVASERGYPVVLGSRAFVHYAMHQLPRGVYMAKSMRVLSERMFGIIRQLGHEIVAFDEEGLVRLIDEEYYAARLSPKTVAQVSHLLAWGRDDARVFAAYPAAKGIPIHVTGNPRLDMLRPELRGYLEPEERARLTENLGAIMTLIDAMQSIDTEGVEPLDHPVDVVQRLRPDVADHAIDRERFQSIAPATEAGMYLVPRVVE